MGIGKRERGTLHEVSYGKTYSRGVQNSCPRTTCVVSITVFRWKFLMLCGAHDKVLRLCRNSQSCGLCTVGKKEACATRDDNNHDSRKYLLYWVITMYRSQGQGGTRGLSTSGSPKPLYKANFVCLNRPGRPANITGEPMFFNTLSKSGENLQGLDAWRKGVSDPADCGTLSKMGRREREDLSMVARCV